MKLTKNEKIAAVFLTAIAAVAILFGVFTMYRTIYGPFEEKSQLFSLSELQQEQRIASLQYVLSLQKQDTDKDGLSDYDEGYVYGTSLYLRDTDSDGIEDRAELESGEDPLCHKDEDCARIAPQEGVVGLETPPLEAGGTQTDMSILGTQELPFLNENSTNLSAEELRSFLIESGFPQEQLNAFTDAELLEIWQKTLGGQATPSVVPQDSDGAAEE